MVITEYRRSFPNVPGHFWIKLAKLADESWMISAIENSVGDLIELQNLRTFPTEEGALLAAESLLRTHLSRIAKVAPETHGPLFTEETSKTPTRAASE